jgi:hypothetical protein
MKTSSQIRCEIEALPAETRLAHVRHLAAQHRLQILTEIAASELLYLKGAEDLNNAANNGAAVAAFVKSDVGAELAALTAVVQIIDASDQYADAKDRLHRLLAELDASLATEEAARVARLEAENDLAAAEAAARQKLESKIDIDASVKEARAKLEALHA